MSSKTEYVSMILYDLPAKTSSDQKRYRTFRKYLMKQGYYQLQESVYCRKFKEKKQAEKSILKLKKKSPLEGDIKSLIFTANVFKNMNHLIGKPSIEEQILRDEKVIVI